MSFEFIARAAFSFFPTKNRAVTSLFAAARISPAASRRPITRPGMSRSLNRSTASFKTCNSSRSASLATCPIRTRPVSHATSAGAAASGSLCSRSNLSSSDSPGFPVAALGANSGLLAFIGEEYHYLDYLSRRCKFFLIFNFSKCETDAPRMHSGCSDFSSCERVYARCTRMGPPTRGWGFCSIGQDAGTLAWAASRAAMLHGVTPAYDNIHYVTSISTTMHLLPCECQNRSAIQSADSLTHHNQSIRYLSTPVDNLLITLSEHVSELSKLVMYVPGM